MKKKDFMDRKQKMKILGMIVDGYSYRATAEKLDCTIGSVAGLVFRILHPREKKPYVFPEWRRVWTQSKVDRLRKLYMLGYSNKKIGEVFGIGETAAGQAASRFRRKGWKLSIPTNEGEK